MPLHEFGVYFDRLEGGRVRVRTSPVMNVGLAGVVLKNNGFRWNVGTQRFEGELSGETPQELARVTRLLRAIIEEMMEEG